MPLGPLSRTSLTLHERGLHEEIWRHSTGQFPASCFSFHMLIASVSPASGIVHLTSTFSLSTLSECELLRGRLLCVLDGKRRARLGRTLAGVTECMNVSWGSSALFSILRIAGD